MALAWAISTTLEYRENLNDARVDASLLASQETEKLVNDIRDDLEFLPGTAKSLAERVANQAWTHESLKSHIKSILLSNTSLFGVGVAFAPYSFNPDLRLIAPYFARSNHSIEYFDVADFYDYTAEKYKDWYKETLESGAQWKKLSVDPVTNTWVIQYAVPIQREGETLGLVFMSHKLDALQRRIDLTDLGEKGYSFVTDDSGRLVDYPFAEKVLSATQLGDLPGFQSSKAQSLVQTILARQSGTAGYVSDITNKASWLYYSPVDNTNLIVLTVFERPSVLPRSESQRSLFIQILLSWNLAIIFLVCHVFPLRTFHKLLSYWISMAIISVSMLTSIGVMWYVSLNSGPQEEKDVRNIVSYAQLEEFQREYTEESVGTRSDPPLYIPTGVFVQSIEFTSANNVIMTGYIWQRYSEGYHDGLTREIVIPEAEKLEKLPEVYKKLEDGDETLGWYFRVTLRQNFDYSQYPLDRQSVWLRLWHKDFDQNVVLVPDLDAYDQLNSHWLPGIENDFVLSGWHLERSFFNYHYNSYNTNFGIENYVGKTEFPELYFNIGLKRDFFDPFVSQVTPMLVVLLMLFAILLTSSRDEERNSLLGFSTSRVLASSSALFFVVMVSHIDLRSSLAAREIIYLENIYFITYIVLLIVAINSILFSWGIRFPSFHGISLVHHRDNLVPKLLFWPVVTGMLLLSTIQRLY